MDLTASIVVLATFSANIFICLVSYRNNPKSWTNRLLSLLTLILGSWSLFNFLALSPGSEQTRLFWVRLVMFVTSPMGATTYLLAVIFPQEKLIVNKKIIYFTIAIVATEMVLALSPWMFTAVHNHPDGSFDLIPGPAIALFALSHMGYTTLGLVILIKKLIKSHGRLKQQLNLFLWGNVLTLTLITLTNFIAVVFFKSLKYTYIGPTFTLFLVGFLLYAILRHGLLDIRKLIARAIAYTFIVVTIFIFIAAFIFLVGGYALGLQIDLNQLVIFTLMALGVALFFQPLRKNIEKYTQKVFYQGFYDSNEVLYNLSQIMARTLELSELTNSVLTILIQTLHVTSASFIVLDKNQIYLSNSLPSRVPIVLAATEISQIASENGLVIFEELTESSFKEFMRQNNLSLIIPFSTKQGLEGFLLLGGKASGEVYSDQDIKLFNILMPEVGVAIRNSRSYDEIKRFNITLREEVERATRQLRVVNAKLEELDKLKDDFVSVASHELRTPMTAIRSYSWMALYRSDISLSEKMKRYLSRTLVSTERLINLVNEMLNISRIESGRVEIKPEVFSIYALVKDVFEEVGVKAGENHLNLKMGPTENIPNVFADQDKVHQVLLNLVGNSLKFTPENGLIEVDFAANQTVVGIAVKDSGAGISPEDQSKLFKKFGRLDNSYVTAGTSGGTGLGLYVCKSLVNLMGGEIWVESPGVGQGSTFYFTLPIATKDVLAHPEKYHIKPQGEAKVLEPVTI